MIEFYSYNSIVETRVNLECELIDHEDGFYRLHFFFGPET